MIQDQVFQVSFLWQQRPVLDFFLLCVISNIRVGPPFVLLFKPQHILPAALALLRVVIVARFVACVIHANHAAADGRAAKVVHSEVGAALILVLEPAEALGLPRLLVAHELDEYRFAVLAEDGDDVALG